MELIITKFKKYVFCVCVCVCVCIMYVCMYVCMYVVVSACYFTPKLARICRHCTHDNPSILYRVVPKEPSDPNDFYVQKTRRCRKAVV